MHGVNLMLVSHVPKRFKKYGNISTVSDVINVCSHVGAAIFTYGIAVLSELICRQWTVGVWVPLALLGATVCLIAAGHWKQMADAE
jgi:OPA family glycerol-3-phosphate transporter-like MFS transporter